MATLISDLAEATEPHTAAQPCIGSVGLWHLSAAEAVPERATAPTARTVVLGWETPALATAQPQVS